MKEDEAKAARRRDAEIEAAWLEYETPAEPVNKMRQEWRLRHFEAQGGKCRYCNVRMHFQHEAQDRIVTLDHVAPLAIGGEDSFENTVAACFACNQAKADLPPEKFLSLDWLRRRRELINRPPDRLSVVTTSEYYDQEALGRGVAVIFRQTARSDVWEYCRSEQWVRVPAGRARNRSGDPVLVKLKGSLRVYFEDDCSAAD